MRHAAKSLLAGVIAIMASIHGAYAQGDSAQRPLELKGTLQGGMMGIGGESTGFKLDGVSVEADLSGVEDAGDLAGQAVRVQGYFELKQYVERGPVWLLHVLAAKAASDTSPFPAPAASGTPAAGASDAVRAEALRLIRDDAQFREQVRAALSAADRGPAPQ